MRPENLLEWTRKQPFEPFRIHVTGGQTFEIYHPDQLLTLRSRLVVGVGGEGDVPDRTEHIALIHVVRVEELGAPRT